jgi:hypothetical protein
MIFLFLSKICFRCQIWPRIRFFGHILFIGSLFIDFSAIFYAYSLFSTFLCWQHKMWKFLLASGGWNMSGWQNLILVWAWDKLFRWDFSQKAEKFGPSKNLSKLSMCTKITRSQWIWAGWQKPFEEFELRTPFDAIFVKRGQKWPALLRLMLSQNCAKTSR